MNLLQVSNLTFDPWFKDKWKANILKVRKEIHFERNRKNGIFIVIALKQKLQKTLVDQYFSASLTYKLHCF